MCGQSAIKIEGGTSNQAVLCYQTTMTELDVNLCQPKPSLDGGLAAAQNRAKYAILCTCHMQSAPHYCLTFDTARHADSSPLSAPLSGNCMTSPSDLGIWKHQATSRLVGWIKTHSVGTKLSSCFSTPLLINRRAENAWTDCEQPR